MDPRLEFRQSLLGLLHESTSRRALLKGSVAAGAVAFGSLPVAQGALGPVSRAAAQDDTTWAEAPVQFTWVDIAEPTSIDPAVVQDTTSFSFSRNVYEPLFEIDPAQLQLIPALATDYTVSEDGLTYTFTLRQGVTFHSGNPFTADDVKATIDRLMTINQGPAFLVTAGTVVTVVAPQTVTFTTPQPDPFLVAHLVKIGIVSAQAIAANPDDDGTARTWFQDNADGTGPYMLGGYERGTRITLAKNPSWWRGWQPGSIDEIAFLWAPETSTRVQMLESGEADLIAWTPPTEAQRVGTSEGFSLVTWSTFDTDPAIYINTQKAPTDNVAFRQALAAAFNYQAFVDYNQGFAVTPAGPVPSDFPGGAPDLTPFTQDLDRARQLLTESGIDPGSVELDFVVPAGTASFAFAATVLQDSASQLGITINVQEMPWAQMLELYRNPPEAANFTSFAQSPFGLDPIQFISQFYKTGAVYNMAAYTNPDIDAMIAQASATVDEVERNAILVEVQHRVVTEAANIWSCRPQTLDAVPDHVRGYVMDPTDYRWATKFYPIRIAQL